MFKLSFYQANVKNLFVNSVLLCPTSICICFFNVFPTPVFISALTHQASRTYFWHTHLPKQIVTCTSSFHQNFNILTVYCITCKSISGLQKLMAGMGAKRMRHMLRQERLKKNIPLNRKVPLAMQLKHYALSFVLTLSKFNL